MVFDLSGLHYSLVFTYTYSSSGVPNPCTVSGTRGLPNADFKDLENVTAAQIIPPPPPIPAADWAEQPNWLKAGMLFTVFGGAIGLAVTAWDKYQKWKEARSESDQKEIEKDLREINQHFNGLLDRVNAASAAVAALANPDPGFNLADQSDPVEEAMRAQVNQEIRDQHVADLSQLNMDRVRAAATEAAKNCLRDACADANRPAILERLGGFADILDDHAREMRVQEKVRMYLANFSLFTDPGSVPWVRDVVTVEVARNKAEAAREAVNQGTAKVNLLHAQLQAAREDVKAARQEKEQLEKESQENPKKEGLEQQLKAINQKIENLDRAEAERSKATADAQTELNSQTNDRNVREDEQRTAEERAQETKADVFRGEV